MWHKGKKKNPIVSLALLLALASTPVITSLFKSNYVLAQSPTETPSFPLPTAVPNDTTIRVDGSASMTRANEALKQRFEKEYSGANVELATNGTDDALKALQDGEIDIAAIGRELTPQEEEQGLEQQRLRREKIAIVVGKDNPFKGDLTNQQFTKVYRGEITDWSELGGASGKIRVIDRPDISDTREAFRNYPLFKGDLFKTGSTATQLDSDDPAEVVKQLGDDGISFVLANQVSKLDNVRILSMHNTLPDDPRYPYSQPLVYVFKNNPSEAVQNFVGFATAEPGREAIEEAREQEAAAVAQAVSGDGAVATPGSTEAATADGKNETASKGTATNTSASDGDATGNQAFLPADSAGEVEGRTAFPWWWLLLPAAVIGALALWWLLGRRKSQEDDTVARGALPKDSDLPPPFTPSSTSTSGAVKEPEPVANTPAGTAQMDAAPVEPVVNKTDSAPGINAAGIGLGIAGLGAAAASSRNQQDTSEVSENVAEPSSQLPLDSPDVQQADVSNDLEEVPSGQQPDIPDTGLDLEAPAAVVNTSYPSLPLVSNPTDEEAPPTEQDEEAPPKISSQEELPPASTNKWLGNFSLEAGAEKIKLKLAHKDAAELTEDDSAQVNQPNKETASDAQVEAYGKSPYPPLPDVWETPEIKHPYTDERDDRPFDGDAAETAGLISSQFNRGDDTPDDSNLTEENLVEQQSTATSPPDLHETSETEQAVINEQEDSSLYSGDAAAIAGLISSQFNRGDDTSDESNITEENLVEQSTATSPPDLHETPETEQPVNNEQEDSSLYSGDAAATAGLISSQFNRGDDTSDESNITEENLVEQQSTATSPPDLHETPETEQPVTNEQEDSSFSLGGAAAIAGLGGAAALGSALFNSGNDETSDDSNNAEENSVEEQSPATSPPDLHETLPTKQENENSSFSLGDAVATAGLSSSPLNHGNDYTSDESNDAEENLVEEQPQVIEETPGLPEVRIISSNEQLADAQTLPPQQQPRTDTLPDVWVIPPNPQSETTEETTSEEQIAQFGLSSNSGDNSTSAAGAVLAGGAFTLGSQILHNDEESQKQDDNPTNTEPSASQVSFGEDVALDEITDQAQADINIPTSEQDSDSGDTDWDRIYGIHHNGATGVPGESNILLANRTPKWAYASWNIAPADREAMQNKGATQLVLRLYDVSNIDLSYQEAKLVQQYDCEETVSHRYVAIPNSDKDYIAEIGYITQDKDWLLVSRSPIIRVFSRPHKNFWFEADAELIIHGATEPGSTVNIDGHDIKVKPDGTFHLRIPFTESLIDYLITAVAPDNEQARTIHMQFSQTERKDS